MALYRIHVPSYVKTICFPWLGGDVAHIQPLRWRDLNSSSYVVDEQVWQDTGEQTSWPGDYNVGLQDGPNGVGIGAHPVWSQEYTFYGLTRLGNRRFPVNARQALGCLAQTIRLTQFGNQGHILQGGRKNPASYG
jgi:hypothetical protein